MPRRDQPGSSQTTELTTEQLGQMSERVAPHVVSSIWKSIKRQLWLVFLVIGVFGASIVTAGRYFLKESVDSSIDEETKDLETRFENVKDKLSKANASFERMDTDFKELMKKLVPTEAAAKTADARAKDAREKADEAGRNVDTFRSKLDELTKRGAQLTKEIQKLETVRASLSAEVEEFKKGLKELKDEAERHRAARLDRNLRLLRTRSAMPHVVKNAVAQTAEDALSGCLGDKRQVAFGLLLDDLKDRLLDPSIRAEAAWALGAFGEEALGPLLEVAEDHEELLVVRVAATKALSAIGASAKDTLLSKLHGWKDPPGDEEHRRALEIRAALIVALATIDEDGLLEVVKWALDNNDVRVLWTRIGKPAVPVLAADLADRRSETRALALRALIRLAEARIDASAAIEPLISTLQRDALPKHRAAAAEALGEIGMRHERVVPALLARAQGDEDPLVVMESIRAIGEFGGNGAAAVDHLLRVLQGTATGTSSPEIAEAAALALGHIASRSNSRVRDALKAVADQEGHPLMPAATFALESLR